MNYKNIIKNRNTRIKIMNMLSFVPDKQMVKLQYRIKTGRKLNLKDPKRFTEKLQLYKLNYKNPILRQCVDKYEVRKYVTDLGLGNILNDCYGVYDNFEGIDFDSLPKSFVLKDTLGGGGNSVIVVKDKSKLDYDTLRITLNEWVKTPINCKNPGREWPYQNGYPHRILAEKLIVPEDATTGLVDYKFYCFDGKCKFIMVSFGRVLGKDATMNFYDRDLNFLHCKRVGEKPPVSNFILPSNIDSLLNIAERLSKNFPHVRVDLYSTNGKIIFSEFTFYNASGYMIYEPDKFDYIFGDNFNIQNFTI